MFFLNSIGYIARESSLFNNSSRSAVRWWLWINREGRCPLRCESFAHWQHSSLADSSRWRS